MDVNGLLKAAALGLLAAIGSGLVAAIVVPDFVNKSSSAFITERWDAVWCGGRAAMESADRLSESGFKLVQKDLASATKLFSDANTLYARAYECGFADAGLRLAVSYCLGLGVERNAGKARAMVLNIETSNPEKAGRAGDVRRACSF